MTPEKKKTAQMTGVIAVLLIVALANYARLPHEGIRSVDFVQILAIGMLAGMLLIRSLQLFKSKNS